LSSLIEVFSQLAATYRDLLREQENKIGLCLSGDGEGFEASIEAEQAISDRIQMLQSELKERLDGQTLTQALGKSEEGNDGKNRVALEEFLALVEQSRRAGARNLRYMQTSLSFSQALLQELFSGSASYDQSGYMAPAESNVQRRHIQY
jgi:hypothetical protein